ncbi:TspO/MBR related protein [Melghirimyces profundicolus]|uniref:TspO/MBR related protein n=1 Tax=Melghirimyces profundicolus TaxID=1242148 RepID=A0A2T6C7T2_9BACL|nr:TspO/MBR family protein [Melghirimyces profundicolus]PTX64352.1 TspO/MBR related protein [Melghirimyces profundicolus]
MKRKWGSLAVFLVFCSIVAALGGRVSDPDPGSWYDRLQKPFFHPPGWVFGPVWTVWYVLIAISGWMVWEGKDSTERRYALLFWGGLVLLNLVWTCLFFAYQFPGAALLEILLLWFFIGAFVIAAWKVTRTAAVLLLPYWIWVTFVAFYNLNIWWLN